MGQKEYKNPKIKGTKLALLMAFVFSVCVAIGYIQFNSLIIGISVGLPLSMLTAILIGNLSENSGSYQQDNKKESH